MAILTDLQWFWDLATAGATEADQHNSLSLTKGGTVTVSSGGGPDGADCISVGSAAGYYSNASVARTINTAAGFAVNIWAYSTADSATGNYIFSHRDSVVADGHWQISVRRSASTDQANTWDDAGTIRAAAASEATANAWHMFTLVDDATSCRLYVDGVLAATDATSLGTRDSGSRPFAIGAASWDLATGGLRHNGRLAMAGVWGSVLTPDEITWLYNGGAGRRYSSLADLRGWVSINGWWLGWALSSEPSVGVSVTPATGSLTLTGLAPTVSTPVTVTPATGSVILTGLAPTVSTPVTVTPSTGSLALTGFAPTVSTPVTVTPVTGVLVLSGFAPTVATPVTVVPETGVLVITGFAPGVVGDEVAATYTTIGTLIGASQAIGVLRGASAEIGTLRGNDGR